MNYLSLLVMLVHHYIPLYVVILIFQKIALLLAGIITIPLENKIKTDKPYHILSIIINIIINLVTIEYINITLLYASSEGLEKIPLLLISVWLLFILSINQIAKKPLTSVEEKIEMLFHEETLFDKYKKIIPYINVALLIIMNVFRITILSDTILFALEKIGLIYDVKILGNILIFITNTLTGISLIWFAIQTVILLKSIVKGKKANVYEK